MSPIDKTNHNNIPSTEIKEEHSISTSTSTRSSTSSPSSQNRGFLNVSRSMQFPWKLHKLLDEVDDEGYDKIISWEPNGRAFRVHSKERFAEMVMPRYFNSNKFKSFQRNLNLWGFQTCTGGGSNREEKGFCIHPLFVRGQPNLCHHMQRTKIKSLANNVDSSGNSTVAAAATALSWLQVPETNRFPMPVEKPKSSSLKDSLDSTINAVLEGGSQLGTPAGVPPSSLVGMYSSPRSGAEDGPSSAVLLALVEERARRLVLMQTVQESLAVSHGDTNTHLFLNRSPMFPTGNVDYTTLLAAQKQAQQKEENNTAMMSLILAQQQHQQSLLQQFLR